MAELKLNNRFIHFSEYSEFLKRKADISEQSIVFIKDEKIIYTHGQEYCVVPGIEDLEGISEISISGDGTISGSYSKSGSIATIAISHKDSEVTSGTYGANSTTSPERGGAIIIPKVTIDSKGHVSSAGNQSINLPTTTLNDLGITATATDLNYVDGVTSNVQAQINSVSADIIKINSNLENILANGRMHISGIINLTTIGTSGILSIISELDVEQMKFYLVSDSSGNLPSTTESYVTVPSSISSYFGKNEEFGVSVGDICVIAKVSNLISVARIIPLNDAKAASGGFPGADGLETVWDKTQINKIPNIESTLNSVKAINDKQNEGHYKIYYTSDNYNIDQCLSEGIYLYGRSGRSMSDNSSDEYYIVDVDVVYNTNNSLYYCTQKAYSANYPGRAFIRIISTTSLTNYNGTYGDWTQIGFLDSDSKVTFAENHYTPSETADITKNSASTPTTDSARVISNLNSDSRGHITSVDTINVATMKYVDDKVKSLFKYQGTVGTGGTVTSLPSNHTVGDAYLVKVAGSYAGQNCEVGDLIICITTGTTSNNSHWSVINTNWSVEIPDDISLEWGTEKTIATIGGVPVKVKLPSNPVTSDLYGFKTISASGTSIVADKYADTLTIVDDDVVIATGDATNDKITFSHATSGVTASNYGPSSNSTPSMGGSFTVPYLSVDSKGHITSASTKTVTLPNTTYEAYLAWGGRNISGSISPLDAALDPEFSSNRLSYMPGTSISVEYSRDSGSTWYTYPSVMTDAGTSDTPIETVTPTTDAQKRSLVTSGLLYSYYLGSRKGNQTVNDQLRVTLTAASGNLYFSLKKILIYYCQAYGSGSYVKIEKSHCGSDATFSEVGTYNISGWTGWNSIPLMYNFGGSETQTGNVRKIRLTFGVTGVTSTTASDIFILKIRAYGETLWSNANGSLTKNGHLYTWDIDKNVTFPAKVTATTFSGTATSATQASYTTITEASPSTTAEYYIIGSNGSGSGKAVYADTTYAGSRLRVLEGTTSTKGESSLILGNNTAKGNTGNKEGSLYLCSESTGYHRLLGTSTTSNITHTLPGTGGTILNSANYSSYAAKKDHTHTITPSGTVESSFTGKEVTSGTPGKTVSINSITSAGSTPSREKTTPASGTHTHSFTPKGTVSSTFSGTQGTTSKDTTNTATVYSITGVGTLPAISEVKPSSGTHTHSVTASGTVSSSFSGTAGNTGKSDTANKVTINSLSSVGSVPSRESVSVPTADHTHTVTSDGTVTSTFTGSSVTVPASSSTTSVNSIMGVGSLPEVTMPTVSISYSSGTLTITHTEGSYTPGTLPTYSAKTVSASGHTHSVKAEGTVSSTFTGVGVDTASVSSTDTRTIYSITGVGSVPGYTEITVPSSDHTHSFTPSGSVSSSFTGKADTSGTPSATVSVNSVTSVGTLPTRSAAITVSTSGHSHTLTPSGTVDSSFTGTSGQASGTPSATIDVYSITGLGSVPTYSSVSVASSDHTHDVTPDGTVDSNFTGTSGTTGNPN